MDDKTLDLVKWAVTEGGIPGFTGLLIAALLWKFRGMKSSPEDQMTAALTNLAEKVDNFGAAQSEMRIEMTDRLARVETDIKNLKGR